MNKYQEALIYFCNGCHHEQEEGDYGACKRVEGRCKHYRSLKELVDKEKSPTLEEVKKEWEECGYVWKETGKEILLDNNIEEKTIRIYKLFKLYHVKALGENYFENVSFALHQLLTKTFKALGWL